MNKKFLSAILFGALMVTSTGTFVSCKDYDDDIENLQTQINSNKEAIAALQKLVGEGNWVTGVTAIDNGIRVTMSNGQTAEITGINGEDGKDGADGTVVTIIDGFWAFDGVKSEYPAVPGESSNGQDAHEIKIEDGYWCIWNSETGAYEKTPYAVAPVSATENTDGSWTITVKNPNGPDDVINIPATALTSIEVDNKNVPLDEMSYYYAVLNSDKKWGWDKEETMDAGFYSRLSQDVRVLLNPAGVKGDGYNYTFKNSAGAEAPVKFFKTAIPYEGKALTISRATSSNGLWVLPANIEKKAASEIETMRRELYLSFKVNDSEPYRLALEASDSQGKVVRTEYTNTITLEAANAKTNTVYWSSQECLVGKEHIYYPELTEFTNLYANQVYAYKLRLNQSAANLRQAAVYGATVTEDGQGFYATEQAAVYNNIIYDICGIYINGETFSGSFNVYFTNTLTTPKDAWTLDDFGKPALDAEEVDHADVDGSVYNWLSDRTKKVFKYTYTADLTKQVESLSETEKLVWDQAIQRGTVYSYKNDATLYRDGLIGGEGEYNSVPVNRTLNRHMAWSINPRNAAKNPNQLTVDFYISDGWGWSNTADDNFKLDNAYQLTLFVVDPLNTSSDVVAKIVLPFEFTQPTLDITQTDSRFTQWYNQNDNNGNLVNRYLYAYGPMCDDNDRTMHLPLYDAFDAWVPAGNGIVAHSTYVSNAEYYTMSFVNPANVFAWGKNVGAQTAALDNDLDYNARYHYLRSIADASAIAAGVAATPQYEIEVPMNVDYKFYGVYPATQDQIKYYTDGTNTKVTGFRLVYASWLKHSTLKMKESSYNTERGTHILFLDNDDLNFTTPKGDAFYLFNDIDANGAVVLRKTKNGDSFNEVDQHPFTTFDNTPATSINWSAKIFTSGLFEASGSHFSAKQAEGTQASVRVASPVVLNEGTTLGSGTSDFELNTTTGDVTVKASSITEHATDIKVYMVPSIASKSDSRVATGIQKAFRGGMIIQLPTSITDGESVIVTVTLKDYWGYTNTFNITIKKLN